MRPGSSRSPPLWLLCTPGCSAGATSHPTLGPGHRKDLHWSPKGACLAAPSHGLAVPRAQAEANRQRCPGWGARPVGGGGWGRELQWPAGVAEQLESGDRAMVRPALLRVSPAMGRQAPHPAMGREAPQDPVPLTCRAHGGQSDAGAPLGVPRGPPGAVPPGNMASWWCLRLRTPGQVAGGQLHTKGRPTKRGSHS